MERNEINNILYLPQLQYQKEHIHLLDWSENLCFRLMQHCCRSHAMFVCMCIHMKQYKILETPEGKKNNVLHCCLFSHGLSNDVVWCIKCPIKSSVAFACGASEAF